MPQVLPGYGDSHYGCSDAQLHLRPDRRSTVMIAAIDAHISTRRRREKLAEYLK
jgi:hypothetical protein